MTPLRSLPTVGDVPARQLHAWRAFLEAHARTPERRERELRGEQGIPLAWYDVLVHLHEADGHRLRMQDLAGEVLLSKSGLTRLIDRMERAGLVQRTKEGRIRRCRLKANPMAEAVGWLDQYREFWEGKLDQFQRYVENLEEGDEDETGD